MAMAIFKDRKDDVLSMAAERMEPVGSSSTPTVNLEPVKFSQSTATGLEETSKLANSLDTSSVSSDDFYDAEEGPPLTLSQAQGPSSDIVEVPDIEGNGDADGLIANKSIIRHILSQLRIGMDLTRFTLPAFLLAPRSTLEMYASLFGRPNMLTAVTDQPTPRDRMIAAVKWFLGSLSASRRDPALKKPYNPILGETFNCYWDIPGPKKAPEPWEQVVADSGPFPEGGHDAFSFVAEQVSHHPPVSALYGECPAKKVYASGTVCTKIRLSSSLAVKVHNSGIFRLCLVEHDEVYTAPMPHCYVRGILTVPWFEFGGECMLECEKSGHSAKLIFHTKPFRGGKKHKVTAELRHRSEKKPYMYFEGEWDSVMFTTEPNQEPEPFLEASVPTFPKKMRNIAVTEPTDSRLVWQNLTEAILADDDQAAADAKHEVEERQRENVRDRTKTGEVFHQKYFHQLESDPSVWVYNSPLDERLAELR
ncbi:oxysterol-binding protein-related protein 9-like [Halichondria panicea]|uniref:oxysterol-binding protein-related protein 9-like n=1 Tax=Halichondria panicea TaxID=6063 RepID=UPI00312B98DC